MLIIVLVATLLMRLAVMSLGSGATRGLIMVAPALEDYVAGELHRESAAAKERRKMREERGLARPTPPGEEQ